MPLVALDIHRGIIQVANHASVQWAEEYGASVWSCLELVAAISKQQQDGDHALQLMKDVLIVYAR